MVHVTCDLCGKELRSEEDHRYVVKMEVFAAHDPAEITEADLDEDHMEAVSQLLREMEENMIDPDDLEPPCHNFRYDLCGDCRNKFLRDPLSRETVQAIQRFQAGAELEPDGALSGETVAALRDAYGDRAG